MTMVVLGDVTTIGSGVKKKQRERERERERAVKKDTNRFYTRLENTPRAYPAKHREKGGWGFGGCCV